MIMNYGGTIVRIKNAAAKITPNMLKTAAQHGLHPKHLLDYARNSLAYLLIAQRLIMRGCCLLSQLKVKGRKSTKSRRVCFRSSIVGIEWGGMALESIGCWVMGGGLDYESMMIGLWLLRI